MPDLLLYSRPDCHLCEEAAKLLKRVAPLLQVDVMDIEDDLALIERYGDRVPVLHRIHDGSELGWPFDEHVLLEFLNKHPGR